MTSFLTNLVAFVALISILVAVHEYGHYIVGRWSGMKVLRFSIGFGKPIWMRKSGADQTEYCISAIPLGGYVKFLDSREGAVDAADAGRAFDQRPVPARIAVLLAGPAFNFLFAILAYWVLMAGGVMVVTPAVGVVEADSYADRAGLEFGDKILKVGDAAVSQWEATLVAMLGEMVDDGRVPLTLESSDGRQRIATLDVGSDKTRLTEPGVLFDGLGFAPWQPPAVIADLPDDGAAVNSGLAIGDRITSIAGVTIKNFDDLRIAVQPRAGQEVTIEFIRNGRAESLEVRLGERVVDGEVTGYLGVGWTTDGADAYYQRIVYSPLESLYAATQRTWMSTVFTVEMLGRMVTGDVSIKNISGPINIAQIAGESAERGWRYFVGILAVISISLGVLNLLPVPVLDGGQIVFQLAEALKGSPLTERTQIIGQQVGILALLLLMSFAFYNDIARLFG
ncbi:MAG: RIP metalloprotease RseP [Gammaproteobacteria bacterium]|nr:RIP metalloprotease RseP [Gammaproteobacteria bacterium]MDH5241053.1 RIP metalloprotease RseP [Gammaproteobacteria bacterium]MDH5261311.1 RIP metalloprotease RseP [Gammaproteobacteria bacterium]MDH5583344.1 RIP metalloprotease RseP [Gammaproteobacteria bacterium]